jgi:hypothetical protein
MRPGGGAEKGAAFERRTGVMLSLWLTGGRRADLFARNVLSGGRFTLAERKGLELGMPGDLMAAHPLAFDFLSTFLVECKHHASLKLEQYFFDIHLKGSLAKILAKAQAEANSVNLYPLIIAKQNRAEALIIMPGAIGKLVLAQAKPLPALRYHVMHQDSIFICRLEDFVSLLRPDIFIAAVPRKG